jgi:enolase
MDRAIKTIHSRKIPDSRGNPAIEVDIVRSDTARAAVPPGGLTGPHDAVELRDRS